ncbi:polysaccharide deacetylase, partial [Bacillus thuringiensis]
MDFSSPSPRLMKFKKFVFLYVTISSLYMLYKNKKKL